MNNGHGRRSFIAKTYLQRFADAKAMLHAYRKSDGKTLPCHPQSVCRAAAPRNMRRVSYEVDG